MAPLCQPWAFFGKQKNTRVSIGHSAPAHPLLCPVHFTLFVKWAGDPNSSRDIRPIEACAAPHSRTDPPGVYNRFGMPFHNPIPEDRKPRPDKDSGGLATLVQAEKMMQIAILLPSAAFIGWLLGAWADRALHQQWIGIAGILFGGISGLVYVIRLVLTAGKDDGTPGKGSGSGL
ncbi:MAG TPA: AtpZ/AtpI family protein [Terracidiphilus sp.]|nr:AtpZ/AtpI family protein [Terracidiphilus sp.]